MFAIIRRATGRKALATADKGHLHHRLMNLGHGHRRSVVILWTWTALLSGFVLYPTLTGSNPTYLPFAMAALAIVLYTILHPERACPPTGGHRGGARGDGRPSRRGRARRTVRRTRAVRDAPACDGPASTADVVAATANPSRATGRAKYPGLLPDAGLPTADLDH